MGEGGPDRGWLVGRNNELASGIIFSYSNVEKLANMNLVGITVADLWYKCKGCDGQYHWDQVVLIGVSESDGEVYCQSLPSFFGFLNGNDGGLAEEMEEVDTIALRCSECSEDEFNVEIDPAEIKWDGDIVQ